MRTNSRAAERRTSAAEVFETLYDDIVSLRLMPGTRMSEAEIAERCAVSRQPVRDAFLRLDGMGLLLVRPQKATEVRRFSMPEIANARFVRAAIEADVLRSALRQWSGIDSTALRENLDRQADAVRTRQAARFHELDYAFHRLLSEVSGHRLAFQTIAEMKAKVERLCRLSLEELAEMDTLLRDHAAIIAALDAGDGAALDRAIRTHLSRLDPVIDRIHRSHSEYFD